MKEVVTALVTFLGLGILATIIFVKPGRLGGESGGEQASKIISSGTEGFADIIRAVEGG